MNHAERAKIYEEIEKERNSRIIAMVNSERPQQQTQIAPDAVRPVVALLDDIGPTEKLTLILDTNGGSTSTAWRLINLIRSFCEDLEVIVPMKAMSAGTLMSLGADRIVMTKQAALGPIDPSLSNHPFAPKATLPTGQEVQLPVSAEAVRGYIDEVKKDVKEDAAIAAVWTHLADQLHPTVLGDIFRIGEQIRQLASELIKSQVEDHEKQQQIIQLLCSDSGSHDYTINRRKAAEIGLNVEKPSHELYEKLANIMDSYHSELKTLEPYTPAGLLPQGQASANYSLIRGLIESKEQCYGFVTEGTVSTPPAIQGAPQGLPPVDRRSFEGWKLL